MHHSIKETAAFILLPALETREIPDSLRMALYNVGPFGRDALDKQKRNRYLLGTIDRR